MTRLEPTCSRISATCSSTTLVIVQVGRQPAASSRKRSQHLLAVLGVQDLGVELHAVQARGAVSSNAATGVASVVAVTVKPGGASATASPCDIQTDCCSGQAGEQRAAAGDGQRGAAVLRRAGLRDAPPSAEAIAWWP